MVIYLVLGVLVFSAESRIPNGIKGPKRQTGEIHRQCKDCEVAKQGALGTSIGEHVQARFAATATVTMNQTCQQDQLDTLQKSVCKRRIPRFHTSEVITCNDNAIYIQDCCCMTCDNDKCSFLLGVCPYGCGFTTEISKWSAQTFHPLTNLSDVNNEMCGRLNRDGPMCSKCKQGGFSPMVYSYELKCVPCKDHHYNWLKFILVAFFPLTLFYFVVLLFRIDATSPYLYGFITLNQALASPISLRGLFLTLKGGSLLLARLIAIPYTVWNLDFFRSLPLNICLDLTTLQTLALDYAIAVYPLLLILITYAVIELHARGCRVLVWLWRPFHRCCVRFSRVMDIQSSTIKVFATFLLLSYVKLLNTTLDILLPVQLYHVSPHENSSSWHVYYDASYHYFSRDHLPYALMSIAFFIALGISPLVLLVVYPMSYFQRCCCVANNNTLRTFIDVFQGHYKDGTEPGTRDCRWFAGIYFLGRILILYIIFGAVKNAVCYTLAGLSMMAIGMLIIIIQPFKSPKVNTYHTLLPFIMATGFFCVTLIDQAESKAQLMIKKVVPLVGIFFVSPILAVIVYAVYRCYRRCHRILLKRNPELGNFVTGNRNMDDYQAINI